MQWTSRSLRQVRDYASGATDQLKGELGTDFSELRQPLSELSKMRGMTPRAAITKHLLDGDDSIFTGKFDSNKSGSNKFGGSKFDRAAEEAGAPQEPTRRQKPLQSGEAPPIDPDAT